MDWQAALLAHLRADIAVTALIGAKSYWEQVPQTNPPVALPYVTLLDVTQMRPQMLKGWDLEAARIQIDVWASSYASKQAIMEAVLAALVPGHSTNDHTFQRADIAMGPRDVSGERDGSIPIFRKQADLMIHHKPVA